MSEAATIETTYECVECHADKDIHGYFIVRGRREKECRECRKERRNRNRRAQKKERCCMSCKQTLPTTAFEVVVRSGGPQLGARCIPCSEKRREKLREHREREHPFTTRRTGQSREAVLPDFSALAQALVCPDRPTLADYHSLTADERARVYAVQRELARRYSPAWSPLFDKDPPPNDALYGAWARAFLDRAELPAVLLSLTLQGPGARIVGELDIPFAYYEPKDGEREVVWLES